MVAPLALAEHLRAHGLYVELNTGDVIMAAELRGTAQMAGRVTRRRGSEHDAIVARYGADEGLQVWTRQLSDERRAEVTGLGSDADGNILVAVVHLEKMLDEPLSAIGRYTSFVVSLDAATGALRWYVEYDTSDGHRLPVVNEQVAIRSPLDGSTTWHIPFDEYDFLAPRMYVNAVDNLPKVVIYDTDDTGHIRVYTLDADGAVLATDELERLHQAPHAPGGAIYQIRGEGNHNELVKLGPCEAERCTLGTWQ